MSENSVAPETPASSPVLENQPSLINEPAAIPQAPVETSAFEKVLQAGKGVFQRRGILFKRGGGRPRKDGLPNKLDTPLNAPASALPVGAKENPPDTVSGLDPLLVRRCCTAVIKAGTGFFDRVIFRKASLAGITKTKAQEIVNDCAVTTEEAEAFGELATICLQKYGVGSEYAPEIGLVAVVAGVGIRYSLALKTIEASKNP